MESKRERNVCLRVLLVRSCLLEIKNPPLNYPIEVYKKHITVILQLGKMFRHTRFSN